MIEDWAQLYHNAEIAKLLLETRRNHAEKCIGTSQEMQQFSFLFVESWLCRDYGGAVKALGRLAFEDDFRISKPVFTMLDTLNLNLAFVLRDAILRGGKGSADYQKGVEAFKNGRYAEALTHYEAVQPFTTPLSNLLLKANIRLANFQQQFAKGEWTQMPLDDWYCWLDLDGEAIVVNKSHRLRLQSDWEFSKVLFRGKLGRNFELRGELDHSRPPYGGGIGIFNGHTPMGAGRANSFWWSLRVDCAGPENSLVQWAPKYDCEDDQSKAPRVKTKGGVPFVYRCENSTVTFSIAGKQRVRKGKLPDDSPDGEGAFGFGILGNGKGSWAEIWGLEARRLDKDL